MAGSNELFVFRNLGGGSFAPPVVISLGDTPIDLAADDFDQDGSVDLVTANNGDGTVSVVLNNGDGTFAPAVNLPVGDLPRSLTTTDLEGDTDQDVAVVANDQGQAVVRVLRNDLCTDQPGEPCGQQLIFADADELAAGDDPALVTSGDLDGDPEGLEELITISESPVLSAGAAGPGAIGSLRVQRNATGEEPCLGDVDGDSQVGVTDLLTLLAQWGLNPGGPPDFDGNGMVDVTDLLALLGAWGACP